jgi:hypothetical protein
MENVGRNKRQSGEVARTLLTFLGCRTLSVGVEQSVPAPDDDECAAIGGLLGKEKRSTRRKPAPVSICPPQIPLLTQAAALVSQRLTACATIQPKAVLTCHVTCASHFSH